MSFSFEDFDLFADLLHGQGNPFQFFIVSAKSAIQAVVGAIIGNVERGE